MKIDINEIPIFWVWKNNENFKFSKINFSNWKIDFSKFEIFIIFPHSKYWNFIDSYFHDFLRYGNDSWCKRKLNVHTLRWKSFLPPSLVFYPPFLCTKFTENWIWTFRIPHVQTKKGGKKLVEGGKKLLHFLKQHLSFHLHQESLPYLKNSWN